MKTSFLVAAVALTLTSEPVLAGEGEGEPFPPRGTGLIVVINATVGADTGSARYPDVAGYPAQFEAAINSDLILTNGSESPVHTVNSLPPGFAEGTVAYAQKQSVQRYLAERARLIEMVQRRQKTSITDPGTWLALSSQAATSRN